MKSKWFDYFLVRNSKLFDDRYYLRNNEDIRKADINPLMHFLTWGWKEGRNPSESFNTKKYLENNPELVKNGINPLIHFIKKTKEGKRSKKLISQISFKFIIKGLIFFIKLRGIVFFAGYPFTEREKDGYYQRIRSIDNLFLDRWRIYIDPFPISRKMSWYEFPSTKTLVIKPNLTGFEKISIICIIFCLLKCRIAYFHSLLSVGRIFNYKYFWKNFLIKRIIDLHGAVPEEFELQGDPDNAKYFNMVEKFVLQNVDHIIVVTKAMQQHVLNKYPGLISAEFINLPIFQDFSEEISEKPLQDGKPIIIYSGGVQKWQQIPKMIQAINSTINLNNYRIFCPDPEIIYDFFDPEMLHNSFLIIGSKNLSELNKEYKESHYGFILREDLIVNRVACPTKLIEYLAMGIVPIVDFEKIGDFSDFGMKYVRLDQLLDNKLPEEKVRFEYSESNLSIYKKLQDIHHLGVISLKKSISKSLEKKSGEND